MPIILERFRIEYSYIPTVAGFNADVALDPSIYTGNSIQPATRDRYIIDKVQLKVTFSRAPGLSADKTPILKEYKLLLEA